MTIGIFTGKPPSLITVAQGIAHAASKLGLDAEVVIGMRQFTEIARGYDKVIIFQPFYPSTAYAWVALYSSLRMINRPCLFYTTAEGPPLPERVKDWTKRVELIANSEYTRSVLEEVGLNVVKVVPHGIIMDEINHALTAARRSNDKGHDQRVVFGMVSSAIERKGLDKLPIIAEKCLEEAPEARIEVITTPEAPPELMSLPNVKVMHAFGKLDRLQLLSIMATWDFYLCVSHSEGFGLPMIEAQAMGIPCIHADFPPLSELLHPENFRVRVTQVLDYQPEGYGAIWRLHMYDIDEMVEQIKRACDLRADEQAYETLSKKLVEYSKKFDAVEVYKELVL